jgi:hypothetical protein
MDWTIGRGCRAETKPTDGQGHSPTSAQRSSLQHRRILNP